MDKDPNEITYGEAKLGSMPMQVIKFGDEEISAKQLAMIAENMRITLKELGYEVELKQQST